MYLLNTNNNYINENISNNNFIVISIDKISLNTSDGVVINELILLDKNNNIIPYTVDVDNIYDSKTKGKPSYWTPISADWWDYTHLNNNKWSYTSNMNGASNCTIFTWSSNNTVAWCEFSITTTNTISNIKKIQLYLGCSDDDGNRDIALFRFYTPSNGIKPIINSIRFIDTNNAKLLGTINNTTHNNTPTLFSIDINI
jgi:hypothetical protein